MFVPPFFKKVNVRLITYYQFMAAVAETYP